jgi:hypothetical protein
MSIRRRFIGLALVLAPLAGCSLINAYDDVKPLDAESDAGDGGARDKLDAGNDGSKADARDGSKEDAHDGGRHLDAESDHHVEAGDEGNAPPPPQAGAIVVAGIASGDAGTYEYVLSVLDPTTGSERSREKIAAVGIAYDGLRDDWYVLEDTSVTGTVFATSEPFTSATDKVVLRTRTLDTNTGKWTDLAKSPVSVPTIAVTYGDVVALNERIAYVAFAPADAGSTSADPYELVIVDTTSLDAPSADSTLPAPLATEPKGLIGTRASGNAGGEVTLIQPCAMDPAGDAGTCQFAIQTAVVGATSGVDLKMPVEIGPTYSTTATEAVAWTTYLGGGPSDVLALPPGESGGLSSLEQFSPLTGLIDTSATVTFGATSTQLYAIAVSECLKAAFVGERNDTFLLAVPFSSSISPPSPYNVGHNGISVRYEPYTNTVIDSFNGGGGAEISAVNVSNASNALSLTKRTVGATWNPPTDLRPNYVATKQPIQNFVCP